MPRTAAFWTRKLELELVNFVREREFIWKPVGNTNHHIKQKYKAYAEFAARLGRGFTARSVRDRWVNIRTTFNHNLLKLERSRAEATTSSDVYVPSWPLWKPLQFLRTVARREDSGAEPYDIKDETIKEEAEIEEVFVNVRQRAEQTDKPHRKRSKSKANKCVQVLDDLIQAVKPFSKKSYPERNYWFFGKHVTERLSLMRDIDAVCAHRKIMQLLNDWGADECTEWEKRKEEWLKFEPT